MATYKDDLDILKAAAKADVNKLTFNAITELDNKGLLGRYGGSGSGDMWPGVPIVVVYTGTTVPYEDVPDWAKDAPESIYKYVRVLKNEPFEVTQDQVGVIVYEDSTDHYHGDQVNASDITFDSPSPVLIWMDSSNHTIRLNTETNEAFEISGSK